MCRSKREDEGSEDGYGKEVVRLMEDGREWRLSDLLYTDDLVLSGELEEE